MGLCLAALSASRPKSTQQVQLLLASLKRSLSQPFQQLPGIIATFAAEAVYVFMAPGSAMYSPVNKLLLKQPALNIEVSRWSDTSFSQLCHTMTGSSACN